MSEDWETYYQLYSTLYFSKHQNSQPQTEYEHLSRKIPKIGGQKYCDTCNVYQLWYGGISSQNVTAFSPSLYT